VCVHVHTHRRTLTYTLTLAHTHKTHIHAGEDADDEEKIADFTEEWKAHPPPVPVPFKAQLTFHSVNDMASLGSNSQPTTLGWLWQQVSTH